MCLSDLAQ